MKKTLWLLLGFAPVVFGFVDWQDPVWQGSKTKESIVLTLLVTVSAVCCLLSAFAVLSGTVKNSVVQIVLSLLLGGALFALDFCAVIFVGCTLGPRI